MATSTPPRKKIHRLPTETEQRLEAVDRRLEACHASMEQYAARFKEAAERLGSDADDDGTVDLEVDLEVDTSAAHHIMKATATK